MEEGIDVVGVRVDESHVGIVCCDWVDVGIEVWVCAWCW